MSTLLVQPLKTELTQEVRYNLNDRKQIAALIPYILMFGEPAGIFTFTVSKGPVIIYTKDFTSADIKAALSTSNGNAHVFLPFIPENLLQMEKGLYVWKISAAGYVFSDSHYLGWLQQFEDIQNEMDYIPETDDQNSLAYRIKHHKEGVQ